MKTLNRGILGIIAIVSGAAGGAMAAEPTAAPRFERQQQRIEQGWRGGELSRNEMRRFDAERQRLHQERRQYVADRHSGHIDRFERAELRRDLNRADRHIYNERHDGRRGDWSGRWDNGRHTGWERGWHHGWERRGGRNVRYEGHRHGDRRGWEGGWIDRSQWQQREMIERGLRSGRITPVEYRELRAEQRAIRQQERDYRADGYLSGAERADLRDSLEASLFNIRREIRDDDRQYGYGYGR